MKTNNSDLNITEDEAVNGEPVEVVVDIEHLRKSFGNNYVLKDITLRVAKGENLVVLGKSGTGKTVLIKCMVGLIAPDEGRVMVLGKHVFDLDEDELNTLRKKIGFLFQGGALYDSMTVRDNLEFLLRRQLRTRSWAVTHSMVEEALYSVGLTDAIDKMPSALSVSMRKRVGLARTLILRPAIMFYDEPTSGLDPITSREISRLIMAVQENYNTSSIIVTHDIECARITANRIMIIHNGVCAAEGSYRELINSADKLVRSFFEQ
jgi:phospholipid/cholesterol/gamma-HCH transport system ATP-binding protein